MDILLVDADEGARRLLERTLQRWGHRVHAASDGRSAYEVLSQKDSPSLVILDGMMPQLDGMSLCRRLRHNPAKCSLYIILLSDRIQTEDVVDGLDSGADDYITKPFDCEELRARIDAGVRVVSSQQRLRQRIAELEEAFQHVKQLHGLLPICSYCKSIRNDENCWQRVEQFLIEHSDARFSHGICPDCFDTVIKTQLRDQGVPTEGLDLDNGIVSE